MMSILEVTCVLSMIGAIGAVPSGLLTVAVEAGELPIVVAGILTPCSQCIQHNGSKMRNTQGTAMAHIEGTGV